jgi:hypothetical protein
MEKIIRKVNSKPGVTIFNRTRQSLAYAEDAANLGLSARYTVHQSH